MELPDISIKDLMSEDVEGNVKLSSDERMSLIRLVGKMEQEPYKFYIPNGACEEYISNVGNAPKTGKRIFLFSAANGVGKTAVSIQILANILFEHNKKWFSYPIFAERWKLPKIFWFITKDSTLKETIEPEIKKWFPAGRYKLSNMGKTHIYKLTTDTGFEIFFKTIDQDPDTFESATLGAIFYDEPPPEKIHEACTSRLRAGGLIFAQLTPLHRSAWILDKWIMNDIIQKYFYVQYADVWANSIEKGIRGRLTTQNIEFMISQYSPEEKDARIRGVFTHLRGLVYKTFVPQEPFVIEPFDVTSTSDYQIFCVLDPHDRKFPAVAWFAVNRAGEYFVIGEYPDVYSNENTPYTELGDTKLTFKDIADKIKSVEKVNRWKVRHRLIDPNRGKTVYGNTGFTVAEEYGRHGLVFDPYVQDDLEIGHNAVRELLEISNVTQRPKLQIFSNCRNVILAFGRYAYKDFTGKSAEGRGLREDVEDKFKDFADVVRYFSVKGFKFRGESVKVTGWRERVRNKQAESSGSYMGA